MILNNMEYKRIKILLISSESIFKNSSRMAIDVISSLEQGGHQVDLLTKYADSRLTNRMYSILETSEPQPRWIVGKLSWVKQTFPFLRRLHKPSCLRRIQVKHKEGYLIFDREENKPEISVERVLDKIQKEYDLIIILFWQNMITARTVIEIYKKTKTLIFFMAVDMGPLTGGCHYFWDCRNFTKVCGSCPAINSSDTNDFTAKNLAYKKEVYNQISCVFLGNSWMNNFAHKSILFYNKPIERIYPVINEHQFKNYTEKESLRNYFNIEDKYEYILFAGSCFVEDKRKGFTYLVEALYNLQKQIDKSILSSLALVFVGRSNKYLQTFFPIKVYQLAYLDFTDLAKMYSLADLYLSPSIQDAGPMMVNQALMCGTPVVAFEIGTALDVVLTDRTGYMAKYKDSRDFAKGIRRLLQKTVSEKNQMSEECRRIALSTSSYRRFREYIELYYLKYSNL